MEFEYLKKLGFDYNKAAQEIDDELKNLYSNDDKHVNQLFNTMLKLFKTPGDWGQTWFELMWISRYDYRYGGFPKDFQTLLNFIDFIHMITYDTLDDGEIYILKTETYNRFYKHKDEDKWYPNDLNYGFRIYNSNPYDFEEFGKIVLPKIIRDDCFNHDNDYMKTEAIKLSVNYVSFENFIKIIERIISFSTQKYDAIQKYLKDNNISYNTFIRDYKLYIDFFHKNPEVDSDKLDFTNLFTDWKILLYDKNNYSLIKNLTPNEK